MHLRKEKIIIDEVLEKRIKSTLKYLNINSKIIKGNIISINNTNLAYVEPHKLIINDTTYLFFNNCNNIYINNLEHSIPLTHIKVNKTKLIKFLIFNISFYYIVTC